MRRNLSCLLPFGAAAAAALCLGSAATAQPANDLCANAQGVAIPSSTAGTLVSATAEPGPPPTCVTTYAGTPAVWYTLVGNGNTLTVETCSTAVSFDTKLHVYCSTNANPCTSPVSFACVTGNDDGPTGCGTVSPIRLSRVTFCSTAGQTYYVMVSTFSATTPPAPFTLDVIDGASCTTAATCAPGLAGACCSATTGACTVVLATACTGTSIFQGAGVSCTFANPCPNTGACCSSSGTCTNVVATSCTGTSAFQGVGTVCGPTNPCTALLGACCSSTTGACTTTTAGGCASPSIFSGAGTVCDPSPCANVGSCCTTTGTCTIRSLGGCTSTSIFTLGATTCTPNPCTALLGACCNNTTGACTSSTVNGCSVTTSTFSGAGTVCDPSPCANVGSCCTTTGTCTIRSAGGCTATGAVFTLGVTTCTPNPCPTATACCTANGCCTLALPAACSGTSNPATSCTPNPCGPAPLNDECTGAVTVTLGVAATGSTCLATNSAGVPVPSCQATSNADIWYTFTATATAGHTLTTCNSNFDTVLIIYTGTCGGTLTEVECDDDDEIAPCNGLNSLITNRLLTAGTTYLIRVASFSTARGDVSLLITATNTLGSCCTGSVCGLTDAANCVAPSVFVSGGVCTPNPCAPSTGACCCGSTCSAQTAAACVGANTSYSGDGTVCNVFGVDNLTPCCLSDYNQSGGAASVQDIFDFLSGYFGMDPCADINASGGAPTVQDIFDFLSAYFNGGCV